MGRWLTVAKWAGVVVGAVLAYGPLYFDAQETGQLGLPWEAWLAVGLIIGHASLGSIIWGLWRENSEFKTRPRANVVFDGFNDAEAQYQTEWSLTVPDGQRQQRVLLAEFRRARFVNEPSKRGLEAEANRVSAQIEFLDDIGTSVLLEVRDGRWSDLPEVHQTGANIKCIDLSAAGESGTLDIATKGHDEAECYGWNNSGRVGSGLGAGTYQIRVRIAVANEGVDDKDFWFTLTNRGRGESMSLQERTGFQNQCSRKWAAAKPGQSTRACEPPAVLP